MCDEQTTHQTCQDENTKLTNAERWERLESAKEDRKTRIRLTYVLVAVSLCWLIFTITAITLLAINYWYLSDVVAAAFITTTNATVLGLWAIGLRYFFFTKV